MEKKIVNIVFYTVSNETGVTKKAAIFYSDGSIADTTFEEGLDACELIARERNIHTKDAFREMINNDIVHVMSGSEFEERFTSFIPEPQTTETTERQTEARMPEVIDIPDDTSDVDDVDDMAADDEENRTRTGVFEDIFFAPDIDAEDLMPQDDADDYYGEDFDVAPDSDAADLMPETDSDDDYDAELEDAGLMTAEAPATEQPGFFRRIGRGIKIGVACATALAIGLGLYSCSKKQSKEGSIESTTVASIVAEADNNDNNQLEADGTTKAEKHYYNDATIKGLLEQTKDEVQKNAMNNLGMAMDGFNNVFASYYIEKGIDVRAALKFEEVVSLQLAYNDYSRDKLASIYNGADLRSEDLSRAYRDANLQLMGAYAIENSKHPVDMSMLIESQEGKDFYKRYHDAFLAAKEATGEGKIRLVKEFYQMVRNDFPVSEKERTEGISHSETYESIKPYKFAVTPMIAAAEMMWQNLKIDVTLDDLEVDFLNDLGLCNHADKTFERVEILTLSNPVNAENPTFQQYQIAFIAYYLENGTYYVDDAHRELTKLQAFQDAVNWHFEMDGEATYQGKTTTSTETHTETRTWTETQTTYHEETETRSVPITPDAKAEVDAQLEAENEAARKKAEAEAEAERQRLQDEADKHAAEVEEEVKKDEEDLSKKIDDANATIDRNHSDDNPANDTPVNESDLGHGVDFDDAHSDENGNLDSSVSNITADPSGDKTDEPLPDPNATGREFDAKAPKMKVSAKDTSSQVEETQPQETQPTESTGSNGDQWVESQQVADDYYFEDAWVEYDVEYEDAIDSFVESMASDTSEDTQGYQYQR